MSNDYQVYVFADAGATKVKWYWYLMRSDLSEVNLTPRLLHAYSLASNTYVTNGINLNLTPETHIYGILTEAYNTLVKQLAEATITSVQTVRVWFYGAGCGSLTNQQKLTGLINMAFSAVQEVLVEVGTDLTFVGVALADVPKCLVAILGTGSNAGVYELGHPTGHIIDSLPSLGFWLGDDGSGGYVGKQIIRDFVMGEHHPDFNSALLGVLGMPNQLITRFYQSEQPSAFAGKVLTDLAKVNNKAFMHHPYLLGHVQAGFDLFVGNTLAKLSARNQLTDVYVVGGLAYHYPTQLKIALKKHGLGLAKLEVMPMLFEY